MSVNRSNSSHLLYINADVNLKTIPKMTTKGTADLLFKVDRFTKEFKSLYRPKDAFESWK